MSSREGALSSGLWARVAIPGAIALAAFLRFLWPLSDPATRLSWSNGIYTDASTMVHAARNAALFGGWILDYNRDLLIYPLMNALTWLAYLPAGPGRLPGLIVSGLAGTATVVALAWGLRLTDGARAARWGALIAAVSHGLVMFSRVPIAENVTGALLAFSAVALLHRSGRALLLGGVLAAVAVFFGKYHAVGFLFGMILFVPLRERSLRAALPFFAGVGAVVLIWALTLYFPYRESIFGHVVRQSTGYHGKLPFAMSLLDGLGEFYNTIRRSWIFYRLPVMGVLGAFAALWIAGNAAGRRRALEDGRALWAFWFLGMWLYLGLLPYKAPRYFVLVIPPLLALGAGLLARWRAGEELALRPPQRPDEHLPLAIGLFSVAFGMIDGAKHYASMALDYLILPPPKITEGTLNFVAGIFNHVDTFRQNMAWAGVIAVLAYMAILWHPEILRRGSEPLRISGAAMRRFATILLALSLSWSAWQYGWWTLHRTTFLRDVMSSVPHILDESAVVLGPLAPLLTQDTHLRSLPYYGPPRDRDLLARHHVTHLLVGGPGDAELVEKRFPGLMEQTTIVQVWPVRTLFASTLELRAVPREFAGSPIHAYEPTLYERAARAAAAGDWEGAQKLFQKYKDSGLEVIPEVLSLESVCWYKMGEYDQAQKLLETAVERRPRDPLNYQNLGTLALRQGDRARALEMLMTALRLDPKNKDLKAMVTELTR